jgi:hypothetical protein
MAIFTIPWPFPMAILPGQMAKFIYFLMREDAGTAVKFGLVTSVFPNSRHSTVNWFRGILWTSSNLSIFPLSKFFCRRIDAPEGAKSSLIKSADIPDKDAKGYLREPLQLP